MEDEMKKFVLVILIVLVVFLGLFVFGGEDLDVHKTIATVRVNSGSFVDFLHLEKIEGGWKVVNVLWLPHVKERKDVPASLDFVKGEQGSVTHIILKQGGSEAKAKKIK